MAWKTCPASKYLGIIVFMTVLVVSHAFQSSAPWVSLIGTARREFVASEPCRKSPTHPPLWAAPATEPAPSVAQDVEDEAKGAQVTESDVGGTLWGVRGREEEGSVRGTGPTPESPEANLGWTEDFLSNIGLSGDTLLDNLRRSADQDVSSNTLKAILAAQEESRSLLAKLQAELLSTSAYAASKALADSKLLISVGIVVASELAQVLARPLLPAPSDSTLQGTPVPPSSPAQGGPWTPTPSHDRPLDFSGTGNTLPPGPASTPLFSLAEKVALVQRGIYPYDWSGYLSGTPSTFILPSFSSAGDPDALFQDMYRKTAKPKQLPSLPFLPRLPQALALPLDLLAALPAIPSQAFRTVDAARRLNKQAASRQPSRQLWAQSLAMASTIARPLLEQPTVSRQRLPSPDEKRLPLRGEKRSPRSQRPEGPQQEEELMRQGRSRGSREGNADGREGPPAYPKEEEEDEPSRAPRSRTRSQWWDGIRPRRPSDVVASPFSASSSLPSSPPVLDARVEASGTGADVRAQIPRTEATSLGLDPGSFPSLSSLMEDWEEEEGEAGMEEVMSVSRMGRARGGARGGGATVMDGRETAWEGGREGGRVEVLYATELKGGDVRRLGGGEEEVIELRVEEVEEEGWEAKDWSTVLGKVGLRMLDVALLGLEYVTVEGLPRVQKRLVTAGKRLQQAAWGERGKPGWDLMPAFEKPMDAKTMSTRR